MLNVSKTQHKVILIIPNVKKNSLLFYNVKESRPKFSYIDKNVYTKFSVTDARF